MDTTPDKFAIMEQLARWCAIVDSGDLDKLNEVFCLDMTWDFNGADLVQGLDALKARVGSTIGANPNQGKMMHNVSNILVTVDGDLAESMANCSGAHEGAGEYKGQTYLAWLTYNDHWKKTSEGWRIARRIYRTKFWQGPREIVYGKK